MLTRPYFALCAALALIAPHPALAASFDVKAFGAKGDGKTLDTVAINRAIDAAAAAGGGTVDFPAGEYLSYSIHLKSNLTLHLDAGATLIAAEPAPDLSAGYDAPEPNPGVDQYQDFGHTHWHNSLIWGENLENVSIVGPGKIIGRGLSRGGGQYDPLPGQPKAPRIINSGAAQAASAKPGPFGYPSDRDSLPAGIGNKAIALKNCRHVLLRDVTIFHGGHFGVLATGVDNLTVDNLTIDTNRDGIDIDACVNVRVGNCSVNSPNDDGICLKSSYGLGVARLTENVTITNCAVSGYDEGTLIDGTRTHRRASNGARQGRIKLGTEATGGFKNITISNCLFDYCTGLALEEVDGGTLEDITITNLAMRDIVNAPIFVRLGSRNRNPVSSNVSVLRRIAISNIVATVTASGQGILLLGLPDHPIEDVRLSDILITYHGGGTAEQARRDVPELAKGYPDPHYFGTLPAWGLFARHVAGLTLHHVDLRAEQADLRPAIVLDDVRTADFDHLGLPHRTGEISLRLKNVHGLGIHNSLGLPETNRPELIAGETL